MNLNMNLNMNEEAAKKAAEVDTLMARKNYQPTWEEIWFTGWTSHTGTVKKGIMQSKLSDTDKRKLKEVYEATQRGELAVGVTDMKKYTKAHALRLHKVLVESRKEKTIQDMLANFPDNYFLVNTPGKLKEVAADLKKETEIAVDTETTGLDYTGTMEKEADRIVGISFTLPTADYHVYIPFGHTNGDQLPESFVWEMLKPILESARIRKILFNAKFDAHMFKRHGITLKNIWFDGMVAMKLLNENEESYALKNLATKYGKYFGFEDRSATYEELFGKGGFEDTPIQTPEGGPGIGVYYACKDTHLTYKFYKDFVINQFKRLPRISNLYFGIERPITDVSIHMEQSGFKIDLEFARQYGHELKDEIDSLEIAAKRAIGDINLDSPKQLSEALYDKLGLPDVSKKRSTDKKTLKRLAEKNDGVSLLLKYRELNKLYGTYIYPMPQLVAKDGRLHGQFKQVATDTGRFASSNPNLQNLPYKARKMIVPAAGMAIVGADYSQIEPRVLAHFAEDESMIEAYRAGRDLYSEMASNVFKLDKDTYCLDGQYDPTGKFQPRKAIKSVLLGIMYGMGSKTLSTNIGVTQAEAEAIIADFYKAYPSIKDWMDKQIKFAEENEYIETMYGRKRRFPKFRAVAKRFHQLQAELMERLGHIPDFIWDEEYYDVLPYHLKREYWDISKTYFAVTRKVVNTIIQGSAADIMKLALIETYKIVLEKGWKILATIHDEILFEVPEDISRDEVELLENAMLGVVTLKTPMKCDVAFMPERWGEEIPKDEWYAKEA